MYAYIDLFAEGRDKLNKDPLCSYFPQDRLESLNTKEELNNDNNDLKSSNRNSSNSNSNQNFKNDGDDNINNNEDIHPQRQLVAKYGQLTTRLIWHINKVVFFFHEIKLLEGNSSIPKFAQNQSSQKSYDFCKLNERGEKTR